ncbi:MAG: hypothetical protein KF718_27240 [Polyangiaceae bacterium]|nr:hypothetical protein [Polyangiaceae bacterium]
MTTPAVEARTTALEVAMTEMVRTVDRFGREMVDFKREMADFKREMAALWQRSDQARAEERRDWNRRWGEMSNRLGTLVEDLVAPSLPRIAAPYLELPPGCALETALRVKRRHPADPSRTREVDALCSSPSAWLACETRSRLTARHVSAFVTGLPELREFFPEYASRRLFGCLASLAVEPEVVTFAERCGVLVLAVGDELMDVLNTPGFAPRAF